MEGGGQPQGYLALRVWRRSGLPLHLRSRRCTPPIRFSFSSLRALKGQECKRGGWREKHTSSSSSLCTLNISKQFGRNKLLLDQKHMVGGWGGSHLESAVGWRDRQCLGRPIKRKDSIMGRVTPPQSESSITPEHHEREGEKKKRKTQKHKEERFTLVRK